MTMPMTRADIEAKRAEYAARYGGFKPSAQQQSAPAAPVEQPAVPEVRQERIDFTKIPAGKFALERRDGKGLEFFEVKVPSKGKWAGYRFVEMLIGAPGEWRRIRFESKAAPVAVMHRLLADHYVDAFYFAEDGVTKIYFDVPRELDGPEAASVRFTRRWKCCSICSSPLSDIESQKRAMGPVCYGRYH